MELRSNVLILTLYSGENEYDACQRSLRAQTYPHWEHRVIAGLPSEQAHRRLYADIMGSRERFGLFVKLDADMVWRSPRALETIVAYFNARPGIDHATFAVQDWLSGARLMGLHVYSNRVRWSDDPDRLFADPLPRVPGKRVKVWRDPAPLVDHAPDPGPYQAFQFGVHRALKAAQPGRPRLQLHQSISQWLLLRRLWGAFQRSGDYRTGLAVAGAECVLAGELQEVGSDFEDPAIRATFRRYEPLSSWELFNQLRPSWSGATAWLRWGHQIAARCPRAVAAALRRRIMRHLSKSQP